MSTLGQLLAYDRDTRNLRTRDLLESPSVTGQIKDLLDHLQNLARDVYRCDEGHLCRELAEWGRFRAVFVLLPEQLLFGSAPIEEKPLIRTHLQALGIEPDSDLVSAIKCLCVNFRAKRTVSRKLGITDVYINYPHIFQRLMNVQGQRCCYCGVSLAYGDNAALDHVWPFFLGDDPHDGSNWCLCCQACNVGKGEFPFYSLTGAGANWIGPSADGSLSLATRFAALARDRGCTMCGAGPADTALYIVKRAHTGCWILDNVQTACSEHRTGGGANQAGELGTATRPVRNCDAPDA
jgi:5-methylcytosine-specific restriction endonuclease McrA